MQRKRASASDSTRKGLLRGLGMRRARAGRTTVGRSALLSGWRASLSHLWESCKGRMRMYYACETAGFGGWGKGGWRGQYGESKKLVPEGR